MSPNEPPPEVEDESCVLASELGVAQNPSDKAQATQSSSASTTESTPSESRLLGEYTEQSVIGRGGYGVVFKAQHKIDKGWYAIKQVGPVDVADTEQSPNRVLREVHILAKLDHPHIVRHYDAWLEKPPPGEELHWMDDNLRYLYIRMEWCCDSTLREWLRQNRLPAQRSISQTLDWFNQLVSAVKHIHDKKLIHRDIKPGNIFFGSSRNEAASALKIGDFGLATCDAAPPSSGVSGDVRTSLSIVGTPIYMSPEQPSGHYKNSTDIFSLGLVFLEMVHPFETDAERYAIFGALRAKQRPKVMDKLGKEMGELISRMTTFEPEKRPTASVLDNELKRMTVKRPPESAKEIGVGPHAETDDGTDSNVKSEAGTSSTHLNESVHDNEATAEARVEVAARVGNLGLSPGSTADLPVSETKDESIEHLLRQSPDDQLLQTRFDSLRVDDSPPQAQNRPTQELRWVPCQYELQDKNNDDLDSSE